MRALATAGALAVTLALAPTASATPEIPRSLPDGYVVMPFENRSGVEALEWMRAALAVSVAEKIEAHPGLRPAYGPFVLPMVPAAPAAAGARGAFVDPYWPLDAARVAAVAGEAGARFVFTGWYDRRDWKLHVGLRLYVVDGGRASLVGEEVARGDFARSLDLLDATILPLLAKGGRPVPTGVVERITRDATRDFYAYTLYGRGLVALHGLGRPPDLARAEKDLARSVFIDPKFAEAHRLLGLVYDQKGQTARSRGQRTYALDLRPDYYAPLAGLVRIAYQTRDRAEGIGLAERALSIRPWDLEVRYMLGEMRWEEGDVDGAYKELARLVAFKPDHVAARRVLVLIHSSRGDGTGLASELEQIVTLDPTDEAARLDLGAAYHALGRDHDAIGIYEAIARENPKHLQALKFLGDLHRARGDLPKAIAFYEKALAANRRDPRPYFLLGQAYVDAKDDRRALRIYLGAQKFSRYLGETYNNIGAIMYRRRDLDQAYWYLSRAAAKRPTNPRVRYNLALVLSQQGHRERALGELDAAVDLDPADAEIQYARGVVLLRLGRLEEAERSFQECVKLDPRHEGAGHNLRLIDDLRRRAREGEIQVE